MTPTTARTLPGAILALLLLHLILSMPSHADYLAPARFARLRLEGPVAILLILIVRAAWLRAVVTLAAMAVLIGRLADIGTFQAFSRPFNPILDLHLFVSGWSLLSGSVGTGWALALIGAVVAALILTGAVLWAALGAVARLGGGVRVGMASAMVAALAAGLALPRLSTAEAGPWVARRAALVAQTAEDLRGFDAELAADPVGRPAFAALAGRDVIVAFVESYGRSFLDDAEFRVTSRPRLAAVEARLTEAGWHMASAWAIAPTRGGQSWLSHGTVLSGLWIDSQRRYDRLMLSDRRSLNRLFGAAGWRTSAAMPAITLDWPEAAWFGYDVTLDAGALGYRGQPFEWVTMPDQYTWTALDDRLRAGDRPAMIETALITSHAPWTPLPQIVPWEDVGDGAIFDGTRRDGDSPREVWSDPARIRAQYALSLDYALEVAGQYIAGYGDGGFFVVLGDHQPAALLAGAGASAAVPIHVITDDPALLARLPGTFVPGMVPAADAAPIPMQDLRGLLATAYE